MKPAMTKTTPSVPPSAWLAAGIAYLVITLGLDIWPAFNHVDKGIVALWACWKYWQEKKTTGGSTPDCHRNVGHGI